MTEQSRAARIVEAMGLDPNQVARESLRFEPFNDGWRITYQGLGFLSAEQMAALTYRDHNILETAKAAAMPPKLNAPGLEVEPDTRGSGRVPHPRDRKPRGLRKAEIPEVDPPAEEATNVSD